MLNWQLYLIPVPRWNLVIMHIGQPLCKKKQNCEQDWYYLSDKQVKREHLVWADLTIQSVTHSQTDRAVVILCTAGPKSDV